MSVGRYAFLPWVRRGIANEISMPATARNRAGLSVTFSVTGGATPQPVTKEVECIGPGDLIGINSNQFIRMHPRPWDTEFEPNYLVFIEFYDEDFPWRFTPAAADAQHRLAPSLTLFVLKKDEFEWNRRPGRPLHSIRLRGDLDFAKLVPPHAQLHAWAHVQIADDVGAGTSPDLARLEGVLRATPERGLSRLISPRRLEPNTSYQACLVPTYEIGRRAGLGEAIDPTLPGLQIAWPTAREFPVYHEWEFGTAERGDFEELVRRLKPNVADARIGIRSMDIRAPGFGMGAVTNPPDGLVGLEGALVAPTAAPRGLGPASNFDETLTPIVNAPAEAIVTPGVGGDDPLIAPPLYGRWHSLISRLDPALAPQSWFHRLNVDPRYRAAAGLGVRVVRKHQESYMREAWRQVGDVLSANETINRVQFGMLASEAVFARSVATLTPVRALAVTAPVFGHVLGSPTTLRHQIGGSRLTGAALSGAFRKLTRPRGLPARRAFGEGTPAALESLVEAVNDGRATADPPKPPQTRGTWEAEAGLLAGSSIPGWLRPLLRPFWRFLLLLLLAIVLAGVLLAAVGAGPAILVPLGVALLAAGAVAGSYYARRLFAADALSMAELTPEAVDSLPAPATFALRPPGEDAPAAPADAATAGRFHAALGDFAGLLSVTPRVAPPSPPFNLANAHAKMLAAIDPLTAQPRRAAARISIGGVSIAEHVGRYFDFDLTNRFRRIVKCMAYPDIKDPMYKPLADINTRLLVPNIDLIPQNSLSVLIVNRRFIEAYLAGINVEFCSELLWREYPTDQRASCFRQFWDVSTVPTPTGVEPEGRDEALKDIEPIHEWPPRSPLGANPKQTPGRTGSALVLVVRGDLLKRYPNMTFSAQRARWGTGARRNDLVLFDETGAITEAEPGHPDIRFPLFECPIRPDIRFVGFNLTALDVRGAEGLEETAAARASIPANQLGWYFVIQEVVGEPRFGLDEEMAPVAQPDKWDNLSWRNLGDVPIVDFDRGFATPVPGSAAPGGPAWGANAADVAAILYQKPVLVAVHGRELIKKLPPTGSPWTD